MVKFQSAKEALKVIKDQNLLDIPGASIYWFYKEKYSIGIGNNGDIPNRLKNDILEIDLMELRILAEIDSIGEALKKVNCSSDMVYNCLSQKIDKISDILLICFDCGWCGSPNDALNLENKIDFSTRPACFPKKKIIKLCPKCKNLI
jgi:hypothetical protein